MRQDFAFLTEQTQQLKMTPQLLQAINVLQLTAMQLDEFVQDQLLSNPLLESDETGQGFEGGEGEDRSLSVQKDSRERSDINWEEYVADMDRTPHVIDAPAPDEDEKPRDPAVPSCISLSEYLRIQLQFAGLDGEMLELCKFITDCLDEDGYLRMNLEDIAQASEVGSDGLDKVKEALLHIQGMEPPGVGARSLCECLTIQLIRKGMEDPLLLKLVRNHLEDIGANRIGLMAKKLGESPTDIQCACDIIRSLDPKPGKLYGAGETPQYIYPDVSAELVNGKCQISVTEGSCPKLIISPYYKKLLEDRNSDQQLKGFLEERLNSALWLIKCMDQRKQTILAVTSAIMDMQPDFLTMGRKGLKPMTLAQISEAAGVHESTVSRAVCGKYLQTPKGIFELRSLFGGGMTVKGGESVTTEGIKKLIKNLINEEDPASPLSDQALSDILKKEKGIKISRRTVTKYRESMEIPSSSGRKRY